LLCFSNAAQRLLVYDNTQIVMDSTIPKILSLVRSAGCVSCSFVIPFQIFVNGSDQSSLAIYVIAG
jgi:hypothetical protein